jgi:lipocalin
MKNILLFITLTLLLSFSLNQCPNFPTFNTNLTRLLGDWYQISSSTWSRRTVERNCVCNLVRYGPGDNEVKLDQSCRDTTPSGQLYRYFGEAKLINRNETGKIRVRFDGIPGTADLWIVDTDYNNYYTSYSCSSFLGFKVENLWIASRKNVMDEELFRRVAENAKRITGFSLSDIIKTNHTGCSYPTPRK